MSENEIKNNKLVLKLNEMNTKYKKTSSSKNKRKPHFIQTIKRRN